MNKMPEFEIPQQVREMAERNLEQTRAAYQQFLDMAQQAQTMAAQSQGAMMQSALEIQGKAMKFAEANTEQGFKLASELARAKDMNEYVEIQTKHAQAQMQTFNDQAQELGRLMSDAASKATKS